MSDEKKFTHLEVEAALCVWEEINDRTLRENENTYPELNKCREDWGSVSLRLASIHIGQWCLRVYDLLDENAKDRPFDWEIIPAILNHVDWTQPGEPEEFKFPEPQLVAMSLNLGFQFDEWLLQANLALKKGWSIDFHEGGASVADMKAIFDTNPSTTGEEIAQWWADKYGLDRTDRVYSTI